MATAAAAMLRLEAGRNPHDKALITLVGELSTQSELFRQHWASRNVKFHRSGRKRLRHPAVGEIDLNFEAMEFPSGPDLRLNLYTQELVKSPLTRSGPKERAGRCRPQAG
jgi:transcription regulator MmyB-like protein